MASVSSQLSAIEAASGDGTIELSDGATLDVTSLDRRVFPGSGHTKGDLLRYYADVSPVLLPVIADRPLVLRRYPDGVRGKSFFQQNAPATVPAAVRVETIMSDDGEPQRRFVGGNLATLLYTIQMGAISVDPWNARVGSLERVDHAILDLDPGAGSSFATAVAVARLVRETLAGLGREGHLKTSGKRGLHIQLPLAGGASEDEALALAEEVAVRVAMGRPDVATVQRSVDLRPPGTVYVDYLQNVVARTVAAAYAVRATDEATVSTPLRWDELTDDLDPGAFNIATVPRRIDRVGDLWSAAGSTSP
ncbi:MAG: DNA polymerase domain-containing protein [Gemmatimonadaceae bacterium]